MSFEVSECKPLVYGMSPYSASFSVGWCRLTL